MINTKFNYSQICSDLLKTIPERQREVIYRRFALENNFSDQAGDETKVSSSPTEPRLRGEGKDENAVLIAFAIARAKKETLASIGKSCGITRERVRQIERDGFLGLKPEMKKHQEVFKFFQSYFKKTGGLRKEDIVLEQLGGKKGKNQVYFLLTLGGSFKHFGKTNDFYPLWSLDENSLSAAKTAINYIYEKLKKIGQPIKLKEILGLTSLKPEAVRSYLEISQKIQKNSEDLFGLRDWPEINPRGVKDKAYLVFKKEKKPLHFTKVASLLGSALPQTVHNELIKDPRFVLVGRGLYALEEWGYSPGCVKDVILKVLKESKQFLTKKEILEKVLEQRLVKENTVLLNLSDKKYFLRTPEGCYTIKEA